MVIGFVGSGNMARALALGYQSVGMKPSAALALA
jgi:pyrroline-5-carboxylate reductase